MRCDWLFAGDLWLCLEWFVFACVLDWLFVDFLPCCLLFALCVWVWVCI